MIDTAAVAGFTLMRERTLTMPRSNGPAFAAASAPVDRTAHRRIRSSNKRLPGSSYGSATEPRARRCECPIRLASVQAHSWPLGGSGHGVTEGRIAATPGGRSTVTPVRAWSPSGLPIVRVKGENAPAWSLSTPATNDVENGSEPDGHGPPPGAEVTVNGASASASVDCTRPRRERRRRRIRPAPGGRARESRAGLRRSEG